MGEGQCRERGVPVNEAVSTGFREHSGMFLLLPILKNYSGTWQESLALLFKVKLITRFEVGKVFFPFPPLLRHIGKHWRSFCLPLWCETSFPGLLFFFLSVACCRVFLFHRVLCGCGVSKLWESPGKLKAKGRNSCRMALHLPSPGTEALCHPGDAAF